MQALFRNIALPLFVAEGHDNQLSSCTLLLEFLMEPLADSGRLFQCKRQRETFLHPLFVKFVKVNSQIVLRNLNNQSSRMLFLSEFSKQELARNVSLSAFVVIMRVNFYKHYSYTHW